MPETPHSVPLGLAIGMFLVIDGFLTSDIEMLTP